MNHQNIHEFLSRKISIFNGVGEKTKKLLMKKKIERVSDLLWNFPHGYTDRSNLQESSFKNINISMENANIEEPP